MAMSSAKAVELAERLARLTLVPGGWMGAARTGASARLQAMGLPGRRDEYWRYTAPEPLSAPHPKPAKAFNPGDEPEAFAAIDRLKLNSFS